MSLPPDQEMLELFVQEATEHLQSLEADLIALEKVPADPDRLNRTFRSVHSIKGTAGFLDLAPIVHLAHAMENTMAALRTGELSPTPKVLSLLIAGTDKLAQMIAAPASAGTVAYLDEVAALDRVLGVTTPPPVTRPAVAMPRAPTEDSEDDTLPSELQEFHFNATDCLPSLRQGHNFYIIQLFLRQDIEENKKNIASFFDDLQSLGTVIDVLAPTQESAESRLGTSVFFSTQLEMLILIDALDLCPANVIPVSKKLLGDWVRERGAASPPALEDHTERSLVPTDHGLETTRPSSPKVTEIRPMPRGRKMEETVRINVGLLDQLMDLAGEMVLGRNQLVRLAEDGTEPQWDGLREVAQEINTVTSNLQATIMRARLHSVGSLFGKYTRIVRDLSQKLGKEVALELLGDDVDLDRKILEALSDPLTHLVRNSVDHGLEPPAEREAQGKSRRGTIRLGAAHIAGRVQIEIIDDGRGMDPARLKAKALEKGLISADQAAQMSDRQALDLIFAAGFSTAGQVSDISGRGVGMDVVRTNIERLGGSIDIESRLGVGTRIALRLPLTLAIVPALIVGCEGLHYAIPQTSLEEIVMPSAENPLDFFGEAEVLRLREEILPVVRLADILDCRDRSVKRDEFVLVLQLDRTRFGLVIDEIVNTEEIVVKPLGRHLSSVGYYSGATLLGQGEIALILDPAGLAYGRIASLQASLAAAPTLALSVEKNSARVLVFTETGSEYFAVPLTTIARVEQVRRADIERLGGSDCIRRPHGLTLRLLRLGDFLPLRAASELPETFHIIVPRPPFDRAAIVAERVIDFTDLPPEGLDERTFAGTGILGTASLLEHLTIVLDMPAIAKAAGFGIPLLPEYKTLSLTT